MIRTNSSWACIQPPTGGAPWIQHLGRALRRRAGSLAYLYLALCCGPVAIDAVDVAPAKGAAQTASCVWIEGEAASQSTFKPHPWYSGMVTKDGLSNGDWLTTYEGPANAAATWDVELPHADTWTLWVRANPIQAGLEWRLDDGAWHSVDVSHHQDTVNLASDGTPDLRFVAWMRGGQVNLSAGRHVLQMRTTATLSNHAAIDAIAFTTGLFIPNGKKRPGTSLSDAAPGWFAFDPGIDPFRSDALLDLRKLNEKRAGEKGWLTASGDDIVTPDGKPMRFWAINASCFEGQDATTYLYARLAKTGINLTRFHRLLADRDGSDPNALSGRLLDDLHRNVKAAADNGIYVHLSTYFPVWMKVKESDGIEGAAIGKEPFGLLLFEPKFQAMYKKWAKTILTTPNPYTGLTIAKDPAVAIWEIQNEDGLLFWTTTKENLGSGPWSRLCSLYAAWASKRHGSIAKALASWGGERHDDDDTAAGRLGLYGPWEATREGFSRAQPGKQARIRDQVRFYAEQSRAACADIALFLRRECGFKGLITAGNWMTADDVQLGGIERWIYASAGDIVDRHGYFGGKVEGEGSGWSVRVGHQYADKAAVLDPADTVLGYLQIAGKPHIHSEFAWNKPNRYTADAMLLVASYGALQGIDGFIGFALGKGTWANDGNGRWPAAMPGTMGQWPATALQFRRGDVDARSVAVRQVVTTKDLFALKGSGVDEGGNADARVVDTGGVRSSGDDAFDPLSYYTGRVERVIEGLPGSPANMQPMTRNLGKAIDRTSKVVTSLSGQLRWDWGTGLVRVDTPRSQAVTGFLERAGEVRLGDLSIRSGNEYGTVHVISLDDRPLSTSTRMLVQCFTEERMFGFRAQNGRIQDVGGAPINVRALDVVVTFAKPVASAIALDGHGYAAGDIQLSGNVLRMPADRLYAIVTR